MVDIPQYTDTAPNKLGQSESVFNAAMQAWVDYINGLPPHYNNAAKEIMAFVDARNYDAAATYNETDYQRPSIVYGSDGMVYVCLGSEVTGDDPVTSVTGNWQQLTVPGAPIDLLDAFPVGSYLQHSGESPPDGWLEADGSAVSRASYPELFAEIGVMYGDGDGSTTFNVPDRRGRVARGWDHGAGVDPDAATRTDRGDGTAGDSVGTLQDDQYKSHTHGTQYPFFAQWPSSASKAGTSGVDGYTYVSGTQGSGGNETRMKNINVLVCIKY